MKPPIVWILGVVLFVAYVVAEDDLCGKEEAEKCEKALAEAMTSTGISSEEECKNMKEYAGCVIDAAKDCELDSEEESALHELKELAAFDCHDLICLKSDSLKVGVHDRCQLSSPFPLILKANDAMGRPEQFSMDNLICTLISLTYECVKKVTTKQCGEAAGELMAIILNETMPENVREHLENCNTNQDGTSGAVEDYFSDALDQDSLDMSKRSDELELWYRKKRNLPEYYYPPFKKRDTSTGLRDSPSYRNKRDPPAYRKKRDPPAYRKKRDPPAYRKKRDPPSYRKRALVQYMGLKKRDILGLYNLQKEPNRKKRGWRGNSYSWKSW